MKTVPQRNKAPRSPLTPLRKEGKRLKVPLTQGDLGGFEESAGGWSNTPLASQLTIPVLTAPVSPFQGGEVKDAAADERQENQGD
ncbi:MAG: hypothetical protein GC158_12440 [Cyanobacteria bacterium RI_101]|nr:hypothetical protein [Cyanobacteria bacterium RI_101]